jgi:acetyl-CoA acetyltransferase
MSTGAVITGIGQSAIGRNLGRSALSLTAESSLKAIADAGLTRADIDGVATWPGAHSHSPGMSGVGVWEIQDALGLNLNWFVGGWEGGSQLAAVCNAVLAVQSGLARHVLVFRTLWETTAASLERKASVFGAGHDRVDGFMTDLAPFGALNASTWSALLARRHMHLYGTTREQLGQIAVVQRANAALNPTAVFRDPLTLDDYLTARPISTPLGLYDCDVPIDGSTAVIVSAADAARHTRPGGVAIEAMSSKLAGRNRWDQYGDGASMVSSEVGRDLWQRTALRPADVDVAMLYDGFSILALLWLEAMGFVGAGEAGPFLEGGKRIALDGELPINTGGGQLSAGRTHAYGHLYEAVVQLRGAGGARQVPGNPQVALVTAGGGWLAGALLLTQPR